MGINVQSCCHLCRVRVFHYRSEESLTMMPFYYKHRKCLAADPANIETKEDQNQEQSWMSEYPYDEDVQLLGRKYYCKRVKRNDMEYPDDLNEIKSALGLPDDTPEPLVGAIWRLQQRIEDLEVKYKDEDCAP